MDPRIFSDPNIFPCSEEILLMLSMSDEHPSLGRRWFSGIYNILSEGGVLSFYRTTEGSDQLIFQGTSAALYEYIVKFCVQALPQFVFSEQLRSFRLTRGVQKGLDRVSKIRELGAVVIDSMISKFPVAELWDDFCHDIVFHLGSGPTYASSQRALDHYENCVLVEPVFEYEDSRHWPLTWQEALPHIPRDCDVVSDVAYGDSLGMVGDGFRELVSALYQRCMSSLVVAKINIDVDYGTARGFAISKVRPHNTELVVRLHESGDLLNEICCVERERALDANERRNERIYRHDFGGPPTAPYFSSRQLGELIRRKPRAPGRLRRRARERATRTQLYYQKIGFDHLGHRFAAWGKICSSKKIPHVTGVSDVYHLLKPFY